ncbi:DUF2065 domain-containing protein [Cognatilysobacter lacus]|uniref:DUF2065 domain-containing protein n=1 Tax=Cognatilysobacter lacus TaxID=1643323 RepID=A0A5D8ZBA8_9GAMM|nr:DUF2065 family protein [Lysobacter lacus]TZF91333.1 DUF2065 domain-containing protein [Lysobacter lacus]
MARELLSALCLVAVFEGLFLFLTPEGWKRTAERLYVLTSLQLRLFGGAVVIGGLLSLWAVRG